LETNQCLRLRKTEHDGRWSRFSAGETSLSKQSRRTVHRRAEASGKKRPKSRRPGSTARAQKETKEKGRRSGPCKSSKTNRKRKISRAPAVQPKETGSGSCPQWIRIRVRVGRMRVAVLSRPASQARTSTPKNPTGSDRVAPGPTTA